MPKNHYKDERIQKRIPKIKDEQYEYTGMKIFKHFCLVGGTGVGKTNALYDYVIQTSKPEKGTFDRIFLCYKTNEPFYDDMIEELGEGMYTYRSLDAFPSVDEFPDSISVKYKYKFLVIFDDCINNKEKKDLDKIKAYFTYGRKKGITMCFLAQSFYAMDEFIRKQMSYILMLPIKGKTDLNNILRDHGSLYLTKERLYEIYKYATKKTDEEMPFLKIDLEACPANERFSKDWLEYIPIE